MPKLTIDGKIVQAPEGATLLQAAKAAGIEIPTLCYHEILKPYGACRLCVVEIMGGGANRIVTSCNYPAQDGMIVSTTSERVIEARRVVLEWQLGRCSGVKLIQDLARAYGVTESRFGKGTDTCILCGMCVRVCSEVVGANALTFSSRGTGREVSVPFDVEPDACIGCGACAYVCPTQHIRVEDSYGRRVLHREARLGPAKPISIPFMQAVPNKPVINSKQCIHFKTNGCQVCTDVCEPKAINHNMRESSEELQVGAIVVATGFEQYDPTPLKQYGYGRLPNVITGLDFERMANASGPTGGKILLENGHAPSSVAILHCVGSRDQNANAYCSKICCMYSLKTAHLVREKTGAEVYEMYIDMRTGGKGYEEFYDRLLQEGVLFIRGKGAAVTDIPETEEERGRLVVKVEDTLLGVPRRIPVDMVVLSCAIVPRKEALELARTLRLGCSAEGWYTERHAKLAPVSTPSDGIFIAGCCQGPKDIPESVAQGGAAAAQVLCLLDAGSVLIEPVRAQVNEATCSGCKICVPLCPYLAISFDESREVVNVNEALCKACGTCVAACPSGAMSTTGFSDRQIFAEIEGALRVLPTRKMELAGR